MFVLAAGCYLIWKRKNELESRHYDFLSKVLGVIQMVESKMEVMTPLQNDIKDLQRDVESLSEQLDSLEGAISDIENDSS